MRGQQDRPCLGQRGIFALPPVGAGVWVEFEQGDPYHPIWVGCWWGSAAEVPPLAQITPQGTDAIALQTTLRNGLLISDLPGTAGGITLRSAGGATVVVNDTGIHLQNGRGASITLVGPSVTVNAGALCVHGGTVTVAASGARVLLSDAPAAVMSDVAAIAGCALSRAIPPSPCTTVRWTTSATPVTVLGQPLLLQTSLGLGLSAAQAPQGQVTVSSVQSRVLAT
jgi:hypothetical protein